MKSVLVTGGNRTGTSWVGEMLCLSNELFFVWEPFNCMFPAMFSKHPLKRHYRKLLPEEDSAMKSYVKKKTLSEILNHSEGGKSAGDKIRKLGVVLAKTAGYISGTRAPLYKDPTALMSAEWFEQQFQSRVVLTVRHPGAYVHSIRRLNWPMHVEEFANQPWLMETLPEAIQNEIRERIAQRERPKGFVLEDAALCWKVFHQVIHQYRENHPEWLVVKHEYLSVNYISGFRDLYNSLGLSWTPEVETKVSYFCNPNNKIVQGDVYHEFKQDSASLARLWKNNLTKAEKATIRRITEPVSSLFYSDDSWD
ncbi:hypothetical protein DRQ21_11585 [Candidatus Fermentibacteria bacterium]|nr:MAG: hypothetical protein DRQ21_11585 [Candidatus Fermentibacteria bacterium]